MQTVDVILHNNLVVFGCGEEKFSVVDGLNGFLIGLQTDNVCCSFNYYISVGCNLVCTGSHTGNPRTRLCISQIPAVQSVGIGYIDDALVIRFSIREHNLNILTAFLTQIFYLCDCCGFQRLFRYGECHGIPLDHFGCIQKCCCGRIGSRAVCTTGQLCRSECRKLCLRGFCCKYNIISRICGNQVSNSGKTSVFFRHVCLQVHLYCKGILTCFCHTRYRDIITSGTAVSSRECDSLCSGSSLCSGIDHIYDNRGSSLESFTYQQHEIVVIINAVTQLSHFCIRRSCCQFNSPLIGTPSKPDQRKQCRTSLGSFYGLLAFRYEIDVSSGSFLGNIHVKSSAHDLLYLLL